ncbi:MAG TPA: pantoate--beta-alanine ligase [Planctomycetaceae bacterium]|nr:pantoate--beta-alanine ligase [Planctomycetaceae bacterium]
MDVVEQIAGVRAAVGTVRRSGKRVGFMPTMGALHEGHLDLMRAARRTCDYVVTSIFVNPTQFGPHEDLNRYPRPKERDLELCRSVGVDLVFYPTVDEMYPRGAVTTVSVEGLSSLLEGAIRPTHFHGVTTVVAKLFGIVTPDQAFFGQKDYQQQLIIRTMVRDLNMPLEIVTCPTTRDADGLALSSRNAYLSPSERDAGLCLSRALRQGAEQAAQGVTPQAIVEGMQDLIETTQGVQLDYAVVVDPWTLVELEASQPQMVALVAARVGATRLIDNAVWGPPLW